MPSEAPESKQAFNDATFEQVAERGQAATDQYVIPPVIMSCADSPGTADRCCNTTRLQRGGFVGRSTSTLYLLWRSCIFSALLTAPISVRFIAHVDGTLLTVRQRQNRRFRKGSQASRLRL